MELTPEEMDRQIASASIPPELHPVVAFITHALTVHGSRMAKLKAQLADLSQTVAQQADALEGSRAAAQRHAAEADARALRAEALASELVGAATARAHEAEAAFSQLEQRVARLEGGTRELESCKARLDSLEAASSQQVHAVASCTAEIAQHREAVARARDEKASIGAEVEAISKRQQSSMVQFTSLSDLLQKTREWLASMEEEQRKTKKEHEAQTTELNRQQVSLAQALGQEQSQLHALRKEGSMTVAAQQELGARLVSQECFEIHAQRVALDVGARELDGFHQQVSRVATENDSFRRKIEELHGELGAITSAHRAALRDSMQQCGLHIKSLGTEMLLELKKKLDIVEAQRIFDGLREQWNSVDSRQKTLHMEMQAYADVSTELGNEVAAISLQAKGALNSAEQLRDETKAYIKHELSKRPTRADLEHTAEAAAASSVHSALFGMGLNTDSGLTAEVSGHRLRGAKTSSDGRDRPSSSQDGALSRSLQGYLVAPLESKVQRLEALVTELLQTQRSRDDGLQAEVNAKPSYEHMKMIQTSLATELERVRVAVRPRALWTWSSARSALRWHGRPMPISWSTEKLNSLPNVFTWEAERTYVEVTVGGLYYIAASIFAAGAPAISITINGKSVLRRTGAAASRANAGSDHASSIIGVSIKDIFSLSPNSRIALLCDAPANEGGSAHGVLTIEKCW